MPSNYTGNATATQAPAAPPDPDSVPIAALPVAADGDTAASVGQAFKVLADYIAWEKAPRAKASSWIQPIKKYRNALTQSRFMVDHLGFPSGKILAWDEDWGGLFIVDYIAVGTTLTLTTGMRWQIRNDTAGEIKFEPAQTAFARNAAMVSGFLELYAQSSLGVGASTLTTLNAQIVTTADIALSYQWDEFIIESSSSLPSCELVSGLTDTPNPGAAAFSTLGITGCAFVKRSGDTNWFAYVKSAAGGAAFNATGVAVAANTKIRKRIEIIGASASDTSTGQVNFYIDGALVYSEATSPTTGKGLYPWFRASRVAVGTGLTGLSIGANQLRANLWAGDVQQ